MKEDNFSKVSPTALIIADFRARYTNMLFAKDIYYEIKKEKYLLKSLIGILSVIARLSPGVIERACSVEGRYKSNNAALQKVKPTFILELGSGMNFRFLEKEFSKLNYLDTDLEGIIKLKKHIYFNLNDKYKIDSRVTFLEMNALDEEMWEEVGKKYFKNKNKKVAIVHEGLMMYFNDSEQERFKHLILNFLKKYSPNGCWITSDFSVKEKEDKFLLKFTRKVIKNNTKKDSNCFNGDVNKIANFLGNKTKFKILDNSNVVKKLSCIKKANLDIKKVQKYARGYKSCIIQLKK